MQNKTTVIITLSTLAIVGIGLASAAPPQGGGGSIITFTPGTTARAADVNNNFQVLEALTSSLPGGNIEPFSLTSTQLATGSVTSSKLAPGAVSSAALPDFIDARSFRAELTSGEDKVIVSTSTGAGGFFEVRQKGAGDDDPAVRLTTPQSGDGGLVNVYTGLGALAVQLQHDGDIYKTGNNGFVHPHPEDPTQQIVYMSLEGPERGTYFRGSARLQAGRATIVPPEHWRLVTAVDGITVQVTPTEPCEGLYVESKGRSAVVVRELGGGHSDASFDYFVTGLRSGFEKHVVYEPNTMFLPTKDATGADLRLGNFPALIQNGILSFEGKVDRGLVELISAAHREHLAEGPALEGSKGREDDVGER